MSRKFISLLQMLTPWKSLKDCAQLRTMGGIGKVARQYVYVAIVVCIGVLQGSICLGQENPLNPNYCEIQPFGTQDGWITKSKLRDVGEWFGQKIYSVGDVNGDHLNDWVVEHHRVDTLVNGLLPHEVYLYKGNPNGVPTAQEGMRIGPDEVGSVTKFLCAGHFDSDPYMDLVVAAEVFGDTTDGSSGTHPNRVVVYWGNERGDYSNADTSHLLNPGRVWLGFYPKVEVYSRRQQDMNDILIIWGVSTFNNGILTKTAYLHLYELPEKRRWGRNGQSRLPNWQLWNVPRVDRVSVIDHDGDGFQDLVLISDYSLVDTVRITVVYGTNTEYFDTVRTESVSLERANGRVAEMTDITGDGIPDLIVNAGSQELVKIFIGRRGHRLKEQYGTGIDPPDIPRGRPFARPWAHIKLPYSLDPTRWGRIGFEPLWDIGDIGNDGIADVVVAARPYMYVYSTGKYSDSYIDATLAVPNDGVNALTYAARLGDIDGSGRDAVAVSYGYAPGGIAFFHTSKCVEDAGGNEVPLPPGTGRPTTSVEEPLQAMTGVRVNLQLAISPNPSTNRVGVHWSGSGSARISVHDALGNEAGRWITNDNHLDLDLTGWSKGSYILTVRAGNEVISEKLVLQ
jgi:hypothetical protein